MSKSILSKISFSSASLSAALLNEYFQAKAQFFYITEMKLTPELYAAALVIWAIWNSINDPLAGWYMDSHSTRWGRRLPWMIGFWLPLTISFALIWNPPQSIVENSLLLFLWVVVVLIIYDTSYTIVILAWAALFPEIYVDQTDRNIIAGLRQVFSLVALILALIIPPFFVSDGDISSYGTFGWILAGISFVNLGFAFYGCKEPKYEKDEFDNSYTLTEGFAMLRRNKTFQAFLVGNFITYFAYGQVLAMLPFYRKFILLQDETFEIFAYSSALGMTLVALIFWVWITNRHEPRHTYLLSSAIFAITLIPVWFVQDSQTAIFLMLLVGIGLAGQLMVVDLLLADVIDKDFAEHGRRREGLYFGINGFFIRLAILLQAIALAGVSYLTGFDENNEIQHELAKVGIKIQFILLPIIGFLIGFWIIYHHYDLHGKVRQELQNEMKKLITN